MYIFLMFIRLGATDIAANSVLFDIDTFLYLYQEAVLCTYYQISGIQELIGVSTTNNFLVGL